MRLAWQRICLTAVVSVFPLVVLAQSQPLESEYKKLIHVDTDISPLGATPFGENVSTYDGSLSFEQTDFSLKGNGPLITVGRSYHVTGIDERPLKYEGAAADWELEIPRIETYTANQLNVTGWQVLATNPEARCSSFGIPPTVNGIENGTPSVPDIWWYGYHLIVPGAGSQTLQQPSSSNVVRPTGKTIVAMTKDNWVVSCGVTADNDSGEGFVVTSPDGAQYTFAHLVYRAMAASVRPESSGPEGLITANTFSPNISTQAAVTRRDALMMVTKVTDRFGQSVTYSYTGDDLTQISGSDGRLVTLTYVPSTHQVQTINVIPSSGAARTWTYAYGTTGAGTEPTLTSVTLPNGSAWTMNFGAWMDALVDTPTNICANPTSATGSPIYATMTQPSGLSATFGVESITRGRSYVPKTCLVGNASAPAEIPQNVYQLAVSSKVFTGAGIGTQTWSYAYSPANGSWSTDPCATGNTCPTTVWTDVTDPLGNDTRYTFSNVYDQTEGHPVRTDYYSGSSSGTLMRSEVTGYAAATNGPWASPYVFDWQSRTNRAVTNNLTPVNSTVITQDGSTFTRSTSAFDVYGRPTVTSRSSNVAGQASITETTSYLNDTALWVLGLPQEVDNNSTGEVESQNTYNASTDTLASRSAFGQPLMSYGWNAAGQLASFTDPLNHTTTLGNYKRGIPQSIGFPDSTSESLVVDDFGQISSITNQAGNSTSYLYDAIGRIAEIDYPTGDSVAWAKQTFTYSFETWVSHGIAANHWLRGVTQGPKVAYTYFDALMRPIELLTRRSSDGGTPKTSRTDYDFHGNKTFQSYLTEGDQALSALTAGITTNFDALSRVTSTVQPSELGNLTSTTNYLSGARKQSIDPKGNSTTTNYQVFDEPSYDNVIQVSAPEGVTQTITRDLYGNPLSISQGGITKSMVYDSFHRLCRTTEPESGSEVMAYDAANNLAWSASGQAITGTDCGQTQVATAAQTVRGYDAMNRVTSITYPAGTAATAMSYTLTGKPLTATSGAVSWNYGYNKLDLLTAEGLSVDGYTWALGYGYDVNGVLASTVYPDGKAVTYSPDFLGRPTTAGSYAAGATYYPDGDLQGFTFGSGAAYTATENSRNLLANFSYGTSGAVAVSEDLAYDGNANITQVSDLTNSGQRNKTLGYDGLNRLTSANASNLWGTESYTYDTLNNIQTLTTAGVTNTYNYDASNRLASVTSGASTVSSFGYDARGNVTLRNSVPMVFDEANRLTQITGLDTYTYDAQGRRVKKAPATGTPTYYAYNQAGQLMWQYDLATTNGTDYIYLGKKMVASTVNADTTVIGNIDGVTTGTTATVTGWACSTGLPQSIQVGLYEGPAGTGANIAFVVANQSSEPAINAQCKSTGTAYRFSAVLSDSVRQTYPGQPIYAYGASPVGNGDNMLTQSGVFNIPPSVNAPPAPAVLNASAAADFNSINLSWSSSATATSYSLQLSYNGGGWATYYNGPATSLNAPVSADGTYVWRVEACNTNGCSLFTAGPTVTIIHTPTTPAAISVPATSSGPIAIGWSTTTYQTFYSLEQSFNGGAFAAIYNGAANSFSYTATSTGTYTYRVRACNASVCGGYGPTGSSTITIPPASAPGLSVPATNNSGAYTVSWSAVPGATNYQAEQQVNGGAFGVIQGSGATSWSTSGQGNGTYGYRVIACNAGGCGPYSATANVVVALVPAVPTGLHATLINVSKGLVTLAWTGVSGATDYQIKYTSSGTSGTHDAATATSLTGTYRPVHGNITFNVEACNASGCSAWSPGFSTALNSD
ncbi:hypothetical protein [Pinirhizobacter soli]|uniref:hypothetical protein n=1 Tax=Pinirhizobacter soli TaxID=2786953 RepID=UPI002029B8BF|nr:hypothetical protein [Pinirhizobacter soli]